MASISNPAGATSCGPGANFGPTCAPGYYTLRTTLQMLVVTNVGNVDATLKGQVVLRLQPFDDDWIQLFVYRADLAGDAFRAVAAPSRSNGWFSDDLLFEDEEPAYNAALGIVPVEFVTPWGVATVPSYGSLEFDFFSRIDRFPPIGTRWWIWPPQPFNARVFVIPDYDEWGDIEGVISKDPTRTWLVFDELVSYRVTISEPSQLSLWLVILVAAGIARQLRRGDRCLRLS